MGIYETALFTVSGLNHLKEIYKTGDLQESATTRKIRAVQQEVKSNVWRKMYFHNLDAIISVLVCRYGVYRWRRSRKLRAYISV